MPRVQKVSRLLATSSKFSGRQRSIFGRIGDQSVAMSDPAVHALIAQHGVML